MREINCALYTKTKKGFCYFCRDGELKNVEKGVII